MDDKITARLYRALCPAPTELGEYELKMLSSEASRAVEEHLKTCPHCRQELVMLRNYLDELSPDLEFNLVERVKVWFARLLPNLDGSSGGMNLALGLRGEAGEVRTYQAGEALITLEVQTDPDHPERKAMLGLVTGVEPVGMTVFLWKEGEKLAETALDELGNFIFQGLDEGAYELILSSSDLEIHIQDMGV
jgi:hypothetical protein